MNRREVLVAASLAVFFVLLSAFFVDIPWTSDLKEVPLYDPSGSNGLANSMFTTYVVTVILIALFLASAMIGGVYLAKTEEKP